MSDCDIFNIGSVDNIYSHCTFNNGCDKAEAGASDAEVVDAEVVPTSREEAVKMAVEYVLALKGKEGNYVFANQRQWEGVYRILADKGIVQKRDFAGFKKYIDALGVDAHGREEMMKIADLSKVDKDGLDERFETWTAGSTATGTKFDRIYPIAKEFKAKLDELLP